MEYSHPYEEGPLLPVEGWLQTLKAPELMTTTKTKVDDNQRETTQQPEHEAYSLKTEEGEQITPNSASINELQ